MGFTLINAFLFHFCILIEKIKYYYCIVLEILFNLSVFINYEKQANFIYI